MSASLAEQVAQAIEVLGDRGQVDVELAPFTTFRIGGPAAVFVTATRHQELELVAAASQASKLPVVVIGQGSNLLVADDGVAAIVVVLDGSFAEIDFDLPDAANATDATDAIDPTDPTESADPAVQIRAGGAVKLPVLARQSVAASLGGLEWCVGVPGSVGGAVRMNAGGHGSDIAANIVRAQIFDAEAGTTHIVARNELALAYRSSAVSSNQIVEWAEFSLHPITRETGEEELRSIVQWRRTHQPGGANCGSVFTNPPGDSAGRLIDAAGLKGLRVGTASVSEKHANFIQADVGAKASDVLALIKEVQQRVSSAFGVELHPEVRTLGIREFRRFNPIKP